MTTIPAMPPWAYLLGNVQMILGDNLSSGDKVYFSRESYPRVLWKRLDNRTWSVTIEKPNSHYKAQEKFDPRRFYVVVRAFRPLEYIRVEGDDLEAGDVVRDGFPTTISLKIVEIGELEIIDGQGGIRRAQVEDLASGEVQAYTFRNFALKMFTVIGGQKLEAARTDPSLTTRIPTGQLWIGGRHVLTF